MGGRPSRGATSRILGIILACSHIMNYFGLNPFKFKFALGLPEIHLKKWGKIHGGALRVWDPTTNTKPWEKRKNHTRTLHKELN
jgi:hypothetical protein